MRMQLTRDYCIIAAKSGSLILLALVTDVKHILLPRKFLGLASLFALYLAPSLNHVSDLNAVTYSISEKPVVSLGYPDPQKNNFLMGLGTRD